MTKTNYTPPGETGKTDATLLKQIGSTIYQVTVHFSHTSKQTLEDKILRLIESEVLDVA